MDSQTMVLVGIAVLIAFDKGLAMLRSRGIDLNKISRQIDDLHIWHSETDDDGVKVWYTRRSLEATLKSLAENIAMQTEILKDIHRDQVLLHAEMSKWECKGLKPSA